MKAIHYNYCGTNERKDFVEGAKIIFPGIGESYIDLIKPSEKEGRLIMTTLSERNPSLEGPRKHEVVAQISWLYLDENKKNIINSKILMTDFSIKGQSYDYQTKLQRLRKLEGGILK